LLEKRILIIASLDGFANSVRPLKIQQYISQKGYKVDILDTLYLSRLSNKKGTLGNKLPRPSFYGISLFILQILNFLVVKFLPKHKKYFSYFLITSMMRFRGKILSKTIQKHLYNLVICVSQLDSYYLVDIGKTCRTLFDCPTPLAAELYFGNLLTFDKYEKFKDFEIKIYKSCTYLSFNWETYASYVKKYYNYNEKNIVKLNWGTEETSSKAAYNIQPKIIYFGKLEGNWINLPLLSKLAKIYPIDVYGSPAPDPKYGLNYKGYASSDVLSKYQFGLITITDDILRKEGFSAKHLDYLSHGLPVLIPEWRESAKDLKGTVLFNERDLLEKIKYYSEQEQWNILHKEALKQADEIRWENTLKSLDAMLVD